MMVKMPIYIFLSAAIILTSGCATTEYNLATQEEDIIFISTHREVRMGEKISRRLEEKITLYKDPASLSRIQDIGEKLVGVCDRKGLVYRFRILDMEDVNAFALPGGIVYVSKGLLKKVDSDDELACVLGHEIGHIVARHSVKKLQASIGYTMLRILTAVSGVSGGVARGADLAFMQITSGYSQEDELLADRLGAKYAKRAGYNPEAMISFLKRLREMERKSPIKRRIYFRTHPPVSERIGAVKREIFGKRDFVDYIN